MVQEGDKAPDFKLPRDGGDNVKLSQFKGRPVVLYFYPKDDTMGCTKEALAFSGALADFEAAGAEIIGVSPDSAASHDRFKAKHDLNFMLAADEDHAVAEAYGVWVEKNMYGRKFMGVERSTFLIGPDGHLARIWRKVKVPGHADEVLQAVRDLS